MGVQIRNSVAVQNDAETPGDDHLHGLVRAWRRIVPAVVGVSDAGTKVIEAVRELLSLLAALGESPGQQEATTPGDGGTRSMMLDLTQRPDGPAQYQSLAMLAGLVVWFSQESGRSEREILDALATNVDNPDDLAGLAQAAHDEAGTYLVLELPRAGSDNARMTHDSWTKIIQAVRELLSCSLVSGQSADQRSTTVSGGPEALPTLMELIQSPAGLAQYQSLAMLASIIWWFSSESGHSEGEILDGLAAIFLC